MRALAQFYLFSVAISELHLSRTIFKLIFLRQRIQHHNSSGTARIFHVSLIHPFIHSFIIEVIIMRSLFLPPSYEYFRCMKIAICAYLLILSAVLISGLFYCLALFLFKFTEIKIFAEKKNFLHRNKLFNVHKDWNPKRYVARMRERPIHCVHRILTFSSFVSFNFQPKHCGEKHEATVHRRQATIISNK